VLALIARGASGHQVGHRLAIAPKTAETHIEHTYAETGASTRATATLFALQHGPLDTLEPLAHAVIRRSAMKKEPLCAAAVRMLAGWGLCRHVFRSGSTCLISPRSRSARRPWSAMTTLAASPRRSSRLRV
jgi:hypothetical protein